MSKEANAKALERWRKRKAQLADPDHSKRDDDYKGVSDPKARSESELVRAVKDALALGMRPQNLIGEVRAIIKDFPDAI